MVYISPDGTVRQNEPWSIQRLIGLFWGIIAFIVYFFRSLVGLENSSGNARGSRNGRGGGQGPGNGPGGGFKRMGRITTVDDCSMPGGG